MDIARLYLQKKLDAALHDEEHSKKFAMPTYASAAPRVMEKEPLKDIFLGRYAALGMRSRYGKKANFFSRYQLKGTCVGQSHASGADVVMGVNSLLEGRVFPGRASAGAIYAGSRVEIGKRPGTWQGSVGSWAADWLTKFGIVTLDDLGIDDDFEDPKDWLAAIKKDEALGMSWTAKNTGVPTEFEAAAKKRAIEITPIVRTVEEVRASLSNLSPVNLCGGVHPSQKLNDKGVSVSLHGGGGHSTIIIGQYFDGSNWWYDHLQSWWLYYKGGFCRSDNKTDLMFKGSVTRIPESWLKNWLKDGDSYSLVGVQCLEPVDWSTI